MNMSILGQAIWGHNWKRTVEISQTNATSVNLPVLIQVLWGRIWKHTVKKSQANATSVNLPVCDPSSFETFENAHWKKSNKCNRCYYASSKHGVRGDIWKHTLEKNQTNATSVIMPLLRQANWGDIWKCTAEKSHTNAISVIMHRLRQATWGDIWKRTVERS